MMDIKEILKKCCNDTCNQGSIKQCHVVNINNKYQGNETLQNLKVWGLNLFKTQNQWLWAGKVILY